MAFKEVKAALQSGDNNLLHAIKNAFGSNSLSGLSGCESFTDFGNALKNVTGAESAVLGKVLGKVSVNQHEAVQSSLGRKTVPGQEMEELKAAAKELARVGGMEGFSLQNEPGSEQQLRAVNLTLNAQSHLQTAAAEELFRTITIKYEDEGAMLKVRAAGLGNYAYGNSAWQSASDLRPIFGLLRTGEMFKDDVLALVPVYPEDDAADTRRLFVSADLATPQEVNYADSDAYGREAHLTQYLKVPSTIPNLLGLSQAPGQRPWTSTDEIESNSITIRSLLATAKIDGGAAQPFFVNTGTMSNNTFGPTTTSQSSDDRGLNMHIRLLPGFSVVDKDGNPIGETLFASYKAAGFEPLLNISVGGNYQRQTNELRLNAGSVEVYALREIANPGVVITLGKATLTQKALLTALTEGQVVGAKATFNASNTSRGNFGYRIEVFDATKRLSVRRNSPVSVKYPVDPRDVNQESLDFAIQQMGIVINNQCSKIAFDMALDHLRYITSIDGAPVVGNNQGSNVLPGQHFVTAAAVNRSIKIEDVVSAQNNAEVYASVSAAISNEVADIAAALNTKSGLAAIKEYGGSTQNDWSIICHQNLARFLFREGDARTLGNGVKLEVFETNFDSMIGKILIVPAQTSTAETINPLAGVGVNISKENIVVQGSVHRENQEYGVVMTMPTFRHWPLNPVIGCLHVEDAAAFLGGEGLLSKLASQRIKVDGLKTGLAGVEDAIRDKEPTPPNP